jgi:hypothetical protein
MRPALRHFFIRELKIGVSLKILVRRDIGYVEHHATFKYHIRYCRRQGVSRTSKASSSVVVGTSRSDVLLLLNTGITRYRTKNRTEVDDEG